jgi:hypothetical protein
MAGGAVLRRRRLRRLTVLAEAVYWRGTWRERWSMPGAP